MPDYFLTNKAVEDLAEIWNYTFDNWSEKQADIYYNLLISSFKKIVKNPGLGKLYFKIPDEIYGVKAGSHIIFYRKLAHTNIEIVRILHNKMDIKSRMQE